MANETGPVIKSRECKACSKHSSKTVKRTKWKTPAIGLLSLLGLILLARAGWMTHRFREAKFEIEDQIAEQRYAAACRNIKNLLSWQTDANGELHFLLGTCELARGQIKEAGTAWEAIPPGTQFSERAMLSRMLLLQSLGKLSEAERLVTEASDDPRYDRTSLMIGLVPILLETGRQIEAIRLIEDRWEALNSRYEGALEPAIKLLLQHVQITTEPTRLDKSRELLLEASRLAPEDDRVWLGRAVLAIRDRKFDEAERWLDRCEQQRPDDPAVMRARLEWGMALERQDIVEQVSKRLPFRADHSAEKLQINAWLAGRSKDSVKEISEFEQLLTIEPGDLSALDRLITLLKSGDENVRAEALYQRRSTIRGQIDRYKKLVDRIQPIRDAEELARLAKQLGRIFEEKGFLTIAIFHAPERTDLKQRLRELHSSGGEPRRSLPRN